MRSHYRALALAISLVAAPLAFAQSAGSQGSSNPVARPDGGEVFFYGPLDRSHSFGRGALDDTGIGRPTPRNHVQVAPVPEPSEWALMMAGLALVGFVLKRNARGRGDAA